MGTSTRSTNPGATTRYDHIEDALYAASVGAPNLEKSGTDLTQRSVPDRLHEFIEYVFACEHCVLKSSEGAWPGFVVPGLEVT